MLLRNSIARTKRFFHRTIESFKSFVSGGYERIPKTPPFNPCSCAGGGDTHSHRGFSVGELDNFYRDFSTRWDSTDLEKGNKIKEKKPPQMFNKQHPIDREEIYGGSFLQSEKQSPAKIRQEETRRRKNGKELRGADSHKIHGRGGGRESNAGDTGGQLVVFQKLKELEMMNASDMEHVLDIEEVIHYYSRLTCPAYLDIVNKFFMEMYSDFFLPQPSSSSSSSVNNYSRRQRF